MSNVARLDQVGAMVSRILHTALQPLLNLENLDSRDDSAIRCTQVSNSDQACFASHLFKHIDEGQQRYPSISKDLDFVMRNASCYLRSWTLSRCNVEDVYEN